MNDNLNMVMVALPLVLAAALIGFAILGSRLGPQRRRWVETFVLRPFGLLLALVFTGLAIWDRDWTLAALGVVAGVQLVQGIVRALKSRTVPE